MNKFVVCFVIIAGLLGLTTLASAAPQQQGCYSWYSTTYAPYLCSGGYTAAHTYNQSQTQLLESIAVSWGGAALLDQTTCPLPPDASTPSAAAYNTDVASGGLVRINSLAVPNTLGFVDQRLPGICVTPTPTSDFQAIAVAPSGEQIPALLWHDRFFTLPLAAYAQPGLWRLLVGEPYNFELYVLIPRAEAAFYVETPLGMQPAQYLLGGFSPLERIRAAFYDPGPTGHFPGDFVTHIEIQANADGFAYIDTTGLTLHPDVTDFTPFAFFVGERGHVLEEQHDIGTLPRELSFTYLLREVFNARLHAAYWPDIHAEIYPDARVTTDAHNAALIRNGPASEFGVVAAYAAGTRLPLIGRDPAGDWLQVGLNAAQYGWVRVNQVAVLGDPFALPITSGRFVRLNATITTQANVYRGISTDSTLLATLSPGTSVTLIGLDLGGDWVQLAGYDYGWIRADTLPAETATYRLQYTDMTAESIWQRYEDYAPISEPAPEGG